MLQARSKVTPSPCGTCGGPLTKGRRRFCKMECYRTHQRKRFDSQSCVHCGETGNVRADRTFCNRKCWLKYKEKVKQETFPDCDSCGKKVPLIQFRFCNRDCYNNYNESRKKICALKSCQNKLPVGNKKYCSMEHHAKHLRAQNGSIYDHICKDCREPRGGRGGDGRCRPCYDKANQWGYIHRCEKKEGSTKKTLKDQIVDVLLDVGYPLPLATIIEYLIDRHKSNSVVRNRLTNQMSKDPYRRFECIPGPGHSGLWKLSIWTRECGAPKCKKWANNTHGNKGKFCSRSCSGKCGPRASGPTTTVPCGSCKKKITRPGWDMRSKIERSKSGHIFCDQQCRGDYYRKTRTKKIADAVGRGMPTKTAAIKFECSLDTVYRACLVTYGGVNAAREALA